MDSQSGSSDSIPEQQNQQTVVLIMTCVGTAIILPFGLWSLYTSCRAKIRPIQTVILLFCLTIFFYLAFQVFWTEVLNNCLTETDIESLVDCTQTGTMVIWVNLGIMSQSLCFVFFNAGFLIIVHRYYLTGLNIE